MANDYKINYITPLRRAVLEFPASYCHKHDKPPKEWWDEVTERLEIEIRHRNIDFYLLMTEELQSYWQAVRSVIKAEIAGQKMISFIAGQGARKIDKIQVTAPDDEKSLFNLSFNASSVEIDNWRYDWVLTNIFSQARELGIKGRPHMAQLKGAWLRGAKFDKIKDLGIAPQPPLPESIEKPYVLSANKSRLEIVLAIQDFKVFYDKNQLTAIIQSSSEAIKKISKSTGDNYKFLKPDLTEQLREAIRGPEGLGVNMPLIVLVGIGEKKVEKPKKGSDAKVTKMDAKQQKSKMKDVGTYEGIGRLQIQITADAMEASIEKFDQELYGPNAGFELSEKWLRKEIERHGISKPDDTLVTKALASFTKKEDPSGMLLAKGTPAVAAQQPYLHKSYLDQDSSKSNDDGNIDMRGENKSVVKPGSLICEIKYKEKSKVGLNVYGEKLKPPEPKGLKFEAGEGVEAKKSSKFYAKVEGQPVFEKNKISISEIYHHKGNINLKSGNVYFNGPATIDGNIERGATVMVKGDLTVTGSIEAAFVRSGGSIHVKGGIVTDERGRVQAREDIIADYIGNSNVTCGGNLKIQKSILNSSIVIA